MAERTSDERIQDAMKALNTKTVSATKGTDGKSPKQRIQDSMRILNNRLAKQRGTKSSEIKSEIPKQVRKPFTFEYHDGKDIDPSKAI